MYMYILYVHVEIILKELNNYWGEPSAYLVLSLSDYNH